MRAPRTRPRPHRLFVVVMLAVATFAAFWHGIVPLRYLPFAALDLHDPGSWFLDFRLAALKRDRAQCAATLIAPVSASVSASVSAPVIDAFPVFDAPIENGCGWTNAVHVSNAGGARVAIDKMTCDTAAALAMWMAHDVQPLARTHLAADIKSVQHMGVYACRNIQGSKALTAFRSQHARANAIDVGSFVLSDGRTISVAKHWKGDSSEAKFLHAIHARACRYFRVALGPEYNAAHGNHFHLDRGAFRTCR